MNGRNVAHRISRRLGRSTLCASQAEAGPLMSGQATMGSLYLEPVNLRWLDQGASRPLPRRKTGSGRSEAHAGKHVSEPGALRACGQLVSLCHLLSQKFRLLE
jgi:hypothetical protein